MKFTLKTKGNFLDISELSKGEFAQIKKDLTLYPTSTFLVKKGLRGKPIKLYTIVENKIKVPPFYIFEKFKKTEVVNKLKDILYTSVPECLLDPKPQQIEVLSKAREIFNRDFGGCIINVQTGFGKTYISLKLVGEQKLKTLVVVNQVQLMYQWEESIKKFLPGAKIGYIQGQRFEIDSCHIVLATLQTISMSETIDIKRLKEFDLVISDECHHLSAEVFSNLFNRINPRYRIGLSATVNRSDGLQNVFIWNLGDVISVKQDKKQETLVIYKEYASAEFTTEDSMARLINMICEDRVRTKFVANIIKDVSSCPKRKILVLSDRIQHLKDLFQLIPNSALYVGGMKKTELEDAKKKQILLATYHMCSEGFDFPELNTLILATPRSNIIQSIGRIYRKHHEITPMIVDIIDTNIYQFKNQSYKRKKYYKTELVLSRDQTKKEQLEDGVQSLFIE